MNLIIKGSPALLDTSKCMCVWAGVVEVADAGQSTVKEGGPMNVSIRTDSPSDAPSSQASGIGGGSLVAQGTPPRSAGASLQQSAVAGAEGKAKEIYWSHGAGYARLSGNSRFYTDLNLHVKTENCNDGDTVNITIKREDGEPLLGAARTLDLEGTVSGNEAVLENALRGYSLNAPSGITAECSGVRSSIHPRRPKWEDVRGGYPMAKKDGSEADMYMDDVFRYILGSNYDRKMFSNGGAARVSVGLIEAGMDVRKDFLVQDGSEFRKRLVHKDKDNEKKRIGFIASAKILHEWLSSVWGGADVEIKGRTTIEKVQAAIGGRNGVYIILGGFDSGASGAATLWVGGINDALGGLNYVHKGGTVYFWELKGEDILEDESCWRYGESETFIHALV
jgi:hypothetical protein